MNLRPLLLAAALTTGGCGTDGPSAPSDADPAAIRVTANVAGTPIATLVVEVSAADIPVALVFNLEVNPQTGIATGTVKVPPGEDRTFQLTAFDSDGTITHEGTATASVQPGQNPPIQMKLGPRSGQVPVTVSFGSYSVIVAPGAVELLAGETIQLTAEVLDENGAAVGDLTGLQWATSAPWSVAVDANGLVTALASGEASVVATFEGVAGLAGVSVGGAGSQDLDADGFSPPDDCDDTDMTVHPGAPEIVDGKDNDCNGAVDETVSAGLVYVEDQQDLMVVRAGGSVGVGVAPCPGLTGPIADPDHSPDGARVALASGTGIWIVDAAGGCSQVTTDPTDADPDWSPDGSTLAFTRDDNGIAVIWTAGADGSSAAPMGDGRQPVWSPDGTRIAFVAGSDHKIFIADADGSNAVRLTSNSNSGEWDPAWSPDGTRIAFRWGCLDSATEGCALTNFAEIYVIGADGAGQFQLTSSSGDNFEPAWSPDGTRIAYINTQSALGNGFLHVVSADGTGMSTPYTAQPGQRHPTWASSASYP